MPFTIVNIARNQSIGWSNAARTIQVSINITRFGEQHIVGAVAAANDRSGINTTNNTRNRTLLDQISIVIEQPIFAAFINACRFIGGAVEYADVRRIGCSRKRGR